MKSRFAFVAGFLLSAAFAWAQTHTVVTNDQDFLISNGRALSGVYECWQGGYIANSCLQGGAPLSGSGTPGDITIWSTSTTLGDFAGSTCTSNIAYGISAAGALTCLTAADDNVLIGNGSAWTTTAIGSCSAAGNALTYNTSTNSFGCNTIATGGTPGAPDTSVQFNQGGAFGGSANAVFDYNASQPTALTVSRAAGYAGAAQTYGISGSDSAAGTGASLQIGSSGTVAFNAGVQGLVSIAGAGYNVGSYGRGASSSAENVGVYGLSPASTTGTNIGVMGSAANSTQGTNIQNAGGYFVIGTTDPATIAVNGSFALWADGGVLPDSNSRIIRAQGTLPTSPASTAQGFDFRTTSAGSDSQPQRGTLLLLGAGYTGGSETEAAVGQNNAAGTGHCGTQSLNHVGFGGVCTPANTGGNAALFGLSNSSTVGENFGAYVEARGSTVANVGIEARSNDAVAGTNIGVLSAASQSTEGTNLKNVAGWFTLDDNDPVGFADNVSFALGAASDGTGDILRGYNGSGKVMWITAVGAVVPLQSTVGLLPSCTSANKGARATATDCNAACTFGSSPAGSGSTVCPLYCDGSAWKEG